ncbi:cytochrome c [Tundrisphaera lichenicola]|uniref:cytochrome c n=1 Tax=Tundrisphaera lichenicola TaxID=2029860 RepID=UPI003EBF1476
MKPRTPLMRMLAASALLAGFVVLPWSSAPARQDDDDEDRAELRAMAKQSFVENCLMCHGEDMVSGQRLTPAQWNAEVEKMVGWGSPLPPDRKQPLADYLAESYPTTLPVPPARRISPEEVAEQAHQARPSDLGAVNLAHGEMLFASQCAACHGPDARGGELGTNLVEKPVLLRDAEFRTLMRDGRRRMPGFANVLDESGQADLLAWLRRGR